VGLLSRLFGGSDKDRFARELASAIRRAGEKTAVRYESGEFRLRGGAQGGHIMNLHNAYAEYQAAPAGQRAAVVQRFARNWFNAQKEVPADFADVRPDLLPVVRSRSEFEMTILALRTNGAAEVDWPYRVVAGHLGLGVAYDLPDSMTFVQQHQLKEWRVTFDEALEVAYDNLLARTDRDFEQPVPGVWLSPFHDNYDASRLALCDVLQQYEVRGDLVAAVPNRDVLVLTGSEDESGLRFLADLVEEQMEKPRPLSGFPVRLDGQTWLPFLPDPNSPLYGRFRLMQVRSIGSDYADQAGGLNRLHEKSGEDIFVASYKAVQRDGKIMSYCVWSEGADALLPRTDEVYFFQPRGDNDGEVVAVVPWDQMTAVVGNLLEDGRLYPARYRVRRFPNAEQLAELKAVGDRPDS